MDLLGHDPKHVEAVLVAADRLREAYEAMIEGRDVGWLADWQPRPSATQGAVDLNEDAELRAVDALLRRRGHRRATLPVPDAAVVEAQRDVRVIFDALRGR